VRELILARHGESELSARELVNGDPGVSCPLTEAGRAQARALGVALADEPIDLCAVTAFDRARETAELALAGRDVPFIVVAELNELRYGEFEGASQQAFREWVWERGPLDAPPGGGEHRGELAERYARGFATLLDRPEETVLAVAHSLPIRYLLNAAAGVPPTPKLELVEYAAAHRLKRAEVERGVAVLEAWAAAPAF
jgi:broad specificity phosphatase PhoE